MEGSAKGLKSGQTVVTFIITRKRALDEWLGLCDGPTPVNSALDGLTEASFQIVIEGISYRERRLLHCRGRLNP